jgi:hypothetical protein
MGLWGEVGLFRVVLRLSGTKKFKIGQFFYLFLNGFFLRNTLLQAFSSAPECEHPITP